MNRLGNTKFRLGLEPVRPRSVFWVTFLFPDLIGAFLHSLPEYLSLSG